MHNERINFQSRFLHCFVLSAGAVLLVTAVAKLVSSAGSARLLLMPDPIFGFSFRYVFWTVGAIELIVAFVCLFAQRVDLPAAVIAWLATSFAVYRLGRRWVGYLKPCSCLGGLTDATGISPESADSIMKGILAYLLIGSYVALLWIWKAGCRAPSRGTLNKTRIPAA